MERPLTWAEIWEKKWEYICITAGVALVAALIDAARNYGEDEK